MKKLEVADLIDRFLSGQIGPWEWDDFTSIPIVDAELERVRRRCVAIREEFSAAEGYCSDEGLQELRTIVALLRGTG